MRRLINQLLSISAIISLSSCDLQLYTKNDVTNEKADLKVDEAPHLKNSLEWWYFTGHIEDSSEQKELGIEYVFFHFTPTKLKSYLMVNLAITDPVSEAFYYDYKMIPLKNDLKSELPLDLLLNKKVFAHLSGQQGTYQLKAKMSAHNVNINLKTKPIKKAVLHDGVGYENYGGIAKAGYFSYPRLEARGNVMIKNQEYLVKGELWYDRQWNCSGVTDENLAWDWFSIQYEETNSELMLYRLYDIEKGSEIFGGTYTDSKGENTYLNAEDIQIEEMEYWRSTESDTKYPVKWKVSVPTLKLKTDLEVVIPNQELQLDFWTIKFFYWEGMCQASGTIDGINVKGNSYVEMTNRFRIKE